MPTTSEVMGDPEGYAVGQGGAVTQATSRTTAVTLNALNGKITTLAAVLTADTSVSFTLTNSQIAANDHIVGDVIAGAAVKAAYHLSFIPAAGSATVTLHNLTPTDSASEAPVISFVVLKGSIT